MSGDEQAGSRVAGLEAEVKRLQERLAMKDEFVAQVSHELRTPLTAIKEGVSLIMDGSLGAVNAEQQDFLRTVDENLDRLTELISNLLDLSKIEAGRLRLFRRRVAVGELLERTAQSYRALAGRRRVEVAPEDGVPEVYGDPNRLIQVLGNLVSNAVKFTPEDGAIRITAERRGRQVAVSVADTGEGIAKEDQAKLFQRFSQVGDGEARVRSSGLGLALCRELVELHQGSIDCRSAPGKGATFTFVLPVYEPREALQESFRELSEFARRGHLGALGVIEIDLAGAAAGAEALAGRVRGQVHHGDVVIPLEPDRIVILATADRNGMRAMIPRLRELLGADAAGARFGTAGYPRDGERVESLRACAEERAAGPDGGEGA